MINYPHDKAEDIFLLEMNCGQADWLELKASGFLLYL